MSNARPQAGIKLRDDEKVKHIPVTIIPTEKEEMLRKPEWIKIKLPRTTEKIDHIKKTLRKNNLHSVCEEASCPNLAECFNHGTATFMILGDICTRRCPFCDVAHGKPLPPSAEEPEKLAKTIAEMNLRYVVITSVDRDDLRDRPLDAFEDGLQRGFPRHRRPARVGGRRDGERDDAGGGGEHGAACAMPKGMDHGASPRLGGARGVRR